MILGNTGSGTERGTEAVVVDIGTSDIDHVTPADTDR
jgi:hypothetical protein